jgi:sugar phosphate isomerase/epimerase
LTIACVGINNNFGRPPQEQQEVQQGIRVGIDTAQFLGAPVVRLFAGYVRKDDIREAVWKRTVEGLKRAADYAEKAGIVAAVQNHNHNNVTGTGEDVVRLLKEVDHPWCSHMLDTGQYLGSPGASGAQPDDSSKFDVYRSIERTAPLAVFVRAKLYRLRTGKEEWLDYERVFRILRRVKYNGFVSLVYEGWKDMDAMHAVPVGVKFLRDYLNRKE